jgi:hypothetical protein
MINGYLRPWGPIEWLLNMPSMKGKVWHVIGAISTQDRCMSILRHAGKSYALGRATYLEIEDGNSRFSTQSSVRRAANRALFENEVPANMREVHHFQLFDPIAGLKKLVAGWTGGGSGLNVIFDVSAIPEQFYFPMTRWLLEAKSIDSLMVTYMAPARYTPEDLAYNARDWAQLPTFVSSVSPEPPIENVVVGVGFLPFSLPEWLKTTYVDRDIKVSLIFPFSSDPGSVSRGWDFVRRIEANMTLKDDRQVARIDTHDLSACFDRLKSITRNGSSPTVFAPYGPKTHSMAMCLQAINMGAEVYYTHPTFYHPEYSTGVRLKDSLPSGYCYAVRLHGELLYK